MFLKFLRAVNVTSVIFFATVFSACEKDHMLDCFKGTGNDVTEQRSVTGFNKVYANQNVDVAIYPGHDFKVTVTAGKKIIDGITTQVKNGVLEIKNENKCNWVRSFKNKFRVEVWLPQLHELNAYGSGQIMLKDTIRYDGFYFNNWGASGSAHLLFNADDIHINIHTGPADVTMNGIGGILYLYHNGNGPVHAEGMVTNITYTENKGTNDAYVWAEDILEAKISYLGNIYYKGNPPVVKFVQDGSGKFIPL